MAWIRRVTHLLRGFAPAPGAATVAVLALVLATGCFGQADAPRAQTSLAASSSSVTAPARATRRRADAADRCRDAAGRLKDDCQKRRIITVSTSIEILEPVSFIGNTAELSAESFRTVAAVAQSLISNPSILVLEIRGHSDSAEHPVLRAELAQQRAEVVANYIIAQGVDASRVTTYGASDDEPLYARNDIRNRRVEFLILQRDD